MPRRAKVAWSLIGTIEFRTATYSYRDTVVTGDQEATASGVAVMGGLIQDEVATNEDSIPGANRIPVLGQAFGNHNKLSAKSELVVFLRPVVVGDPNERDARSDYYRLAEMINLRATRDQSPIIGIGYGKPYLMLIYQPGIEQFDPFLKYLPHNSIMWIWMRIGTIGFFTWMMLLATVLVKGGQILQRTQDPLLQTLGAQGMTSFLMLFTFGKYDLAIINYRIVIMTGAFIGILSVLRNLDPNAQPEAGKELDYIEAA